MSSSISLCDLCVLLFNELSCLSGLRVSVVNYSSLVDEFWHDQFRQHAGRVAAG